MKRSQLLLLIPFALAILLSGCMEPMLVDYKLIYINPEGNISAFDMPVEDSPILQMKLLDDGRLLIATDSLLYAWNRSGQSLQLLPTGDFVADGIRNSIELSRDGDYLYYSGGDKIKRLNLSSMSSETLVDSLGAFFFSPILSQDQRYLSFIRNTSLPYTQPKGYPLYLDLQTMQVTSLYTGNSDLDTQVLEAWVDSQNNRIIYSGPALQSMNLDGSQRTLISNSILHSMLSSDGRYLLPRGGIGLGYERFHYRNNDTMIWEVLNIVQGFDLAANTNLLFFWDRIDRRTYRYNLDTSERYVLLGSTVIPGRYLVGVSRITPAKDGSSLYALASFRRPQANKNYLSN